MATSPEANLTKRIKAAINARWPSALVTKIAGGLYQTAGLPDLLVVVEGRAVGVEVKYQHAGESEEHARGRVTPGQLAKIQAMQRAGGVAGVVLTVAEALELVASALPDTSLEDARVVP